MVAGGRQQQRRELDGGEAAARMEIKPCSDFFGGTENGVKALNSLQFTPDPNMKENGHPQAELQPNGTDVKLNTHVSLGGGGGLTPNGVRHLFILVNPKAEADIRVLELFGVEARAFVQDHETAHKAHKFGSTDNDGDPQHLMNGYRNNFKIWQACFSGGRTEPWHNQIPLIPK